MSPEPWEQVEPSDRDSDHSTHTMSVSTPDGSDKYLEVDDESYSDTDTGDLEPEPVDTIQRPNRLLTDSVYSDYSEMAFPVKEHLANLNQEQEYDTFQTNETLNNMKICRSPEETEEQFNKRLRKINYLSLAQEFAALKQENADALPFNLHQSQDDLDVSPMSEASSDVDSENSMTDSSATTPVESKDFLAEPPLAQHVESLLASSEPMSIPKVAWEVAPSSDPSDTSSTPKNTDCLDGGPATPKSSMEESNPLLAAPLAEGSLSRSPLGDKSGDFDVYNMESTLPHVDWDLLEEHLQRAAEEENRKRVSDITSFWAFWASNSNWSYLYRIMYVLEWRPIYVPTRRLFWCLFAELHSPWAKNLQNLVPVRSKLYKRYIFGTAGRIIIPIPSSIVSTCSCPLPMELGRLEEWACAIVYPVSQYIQPHHPLVPWEWMYNGNAIDIPTPSLQLYGGEYIMPW